MIVIYAIPAFWTSSPGACASCHDMKPYYKSWRSSSHAASAPNCLSCHVRPGALNLIMYRLMFYREIAAALTGTKLKPWGTTIPGLSSCHRSGCHSLNRLTSYTGTVNISHAVHAGKEKIPCIRCHPGAAHMGAGQRFQIPARSQCKECHAAQMNNCAYCHVGTITGGKNPH
jgi:nitrate/TMAO reductase-like tetraheme cytochrome c subunit